MDLNLMERQIGGLVPKVEGVLHRLESLWPEFLALRHHPAHVRAQKVEDLLAKKVKPLVPELERIGRSVHRMDRHLRQHEQRQAVGRLADRSLPGSERHRARAREASGRRLERLRRRIDDLHGRVERFGDVVRAHVRTAHGDGFRDLAEVGSVLDPVDELQGVDQMLQQVQRDGAHLDAPDAVGSLADAVSTLVFLVSGVIVLMRRRAEEDEEESDRAGLP